MMQLFSGGLAWAASAYILWGISPLFYQHLKHVDAFEIFAFRVLWSVPIIVALLLLTRTPIRLFALFARPGVLIWLALATLCISTSWYLNTWGQTHDQVLMVSLAFFLTPLVSILIGVFYLKERLTALQKVALLFCVSGFSYACLGLEQFPWLTVGIATAFGCYGVIKKQVKVDTLNGLLAEVMIILPLVLLYLYSVAGETRWSSGELSTQLLLVLTAPVTLLPLGLFVYGVKRLANLSSVAILQYIEPSLYFLLAVAVFGEPLDAQKLLSFVLVWIGFIVFSYDGIRRSR